jgi:hypothetical protein
MKRNLSVLEHFFFPAGDHEQIITAVIAVIEGELSELVLVPALRALCRRHPLLRVRVERDGTGSAFFTEEGVPDCEVRVIPRSTAQDWEREMLREVITWFDVSRGPLVRFVCVRGERCSELMIVLHHGIADGLSHLCLFQDLLELLARPGLVPEPLPLLPPLLELLPDAIRQRRGIRFRAGLYSLLLGLANRVQRLRRRRPAGADAPGRRAPYVFSWALKPGETRALVEACRRERTTVTAALAAAFLRAADCMPLRLGGRRRTVAIPVSIRPKLDSRASRSVGLYAIPLRNISAKRGNGRGLWDLARRVRRDLSIRTSDANLFSPLIAIESLDPVDCRLSVPPATDVVTVTNMGRVCFEGGSPGLSVRAVYVGTTTDKGERVLAVTTVSDQMAFTFVGEGRQSAPGEAARMKDQAMRELEAAVGWPAS